MLSRSRRTSSYREPTLSGIMVEPLPARAGDATASTSGRSRGRQSAQQTFRPAGVEAWQRRVSGDFKDMIKDAEEKAKLMDQVALFVQAHPQQTDDQYIGMVGQLRVFLSTGYPARNSKAMQRLAVQKQDDWARIMALQAKLAELREVEQRKTVVQKQSALRATLDRQKEEQEVTKKRDEQEREEARLAIAQDLDKFRSSEEQKRLQREQATAARKMEVDRQLADRQWRKGLAGQLKLQDELAMAERSAAECRQAMEVEVQNQAKAREEFKRSITANEREQLRKLQAKKREQEENALMLRQAIALREKQDKAREDDLQRRRDIQAHQAKEAAARPESKRWIDPNLIEGYVKKREAQEAKEEATRKATVNARTQKMRIELARQLDEKHERECQRLKEQSEEWVRLQAQAQEDQVKTVQERRAAVDKANRFKAVLDKQVAEIRARRMAPEQFMTAEERALNKKLLEQINKLQLEGKL